MQFAAVQTRWRRLANQVNPRLTRQSDWPDLETAMQAAHDNGHDVELAVRLLAELDAGSVKPVADLHARLTASLDLADTKPPTLAATRQPEVTRHSQGRPQPAPAVT